MTALAACTSAADEPRAGPSVTWKAKAATQATELEIADLVPAEYVVSIVQKPTGTLFSCADGQHTWYGSTTIALTPDADAEQIVRALESQFREDERFDVRNRRDVVDEYEIQLMLPETAPPAPPRPSFSPGTTR